MSDLHYAAYISFNIAEYILEAFRANSIKGFEINFCLLQFQILFVKNLFWLRKSSHRIEDFIHWQLIILMVGNGIFQYLFQLISSVYLKDENRKTKNCKFALYIR